MKLWMKLFITTFILTVFSLTLVSSLTLINSQKRDIQSEYNKALSDHFMVCSALKTSMNFALEIDGLTNSNKKYLQYAIKNYAKYYAGNQVYLTVMDGDNNVIFNNTPIEPWKYLNYEKNGQRKYLIKDIDNTSLLFVSGIITIDQKFYVVYFIRDITHIFVNGKNLAYQAAGVNLVVILIIGLILYFLVHWTLFPLQQLKNVSRSIADGIYTQRIAIKSKDEISDLAQDFNTMAYAVEEQINTLNRIAEERKLFIANLTHEIKTPMTSIIGYSDLLRHTRLDHEKTDRALEYIYKEGKRLEVLSQRLMQIIYLENMEQLELKAVSIIKLLHDVYDAVEFRLNQKNQRLEIVCEGDIILPMNDVLMISLLVNLIDNAYKASDDNSIIYLRAYKNEQDKLILEVEDKGKGIPEDELLKVMTPFYTLDQSRTRANNGAGLGLSLCSIIAAAHHADIGVESILGEGTVMKIVFN